MARAPTSTFFVFNDTATTELYPLALHDAFPISTEAVRRCRRFLTAMENTHMSWRSRLRTACNRASSSGNAIACRSEEHTSELQSQSNLVCRLLLEKKKNKL